jgi:hypothetical protein
MVDAVCATVCGRWREAADLWLDVYREPRYRALSAICGLEATLRAGLYDLAQYFHIGIDGRPSLPDFLAEPWRQSLPVRRNRARFYAGRAGASSDVEAGRTTRHLVDVRLYQEAIREIFRRRLYETDPSMAVPQLAECYFALGEHEAFMALHASQQRYFGVSAVRVMLDTVETYRALAALGAVENTLEFARRHPAGALLAPLLETPELVFSPHG